MITLFVTIFVASLVGSLHCAGMCGAFLAIVVGDRGASAVKTQSAYHLGRLATYTALGTIAGALGHMLDLAGALAGIQPVALILAAGTTITFGIVTWLNSRGVRVHLFRPPVVMSRLVTSAHRAAMRYGPVPRAAMIGLVTTLLPCGWLYAFAAIAAGTASPFLGAATMLAFWFGTLPVMASLGLGVRGLLGPLAKRVPAVTCAALVAVGIYTLTARAHLNPAKLIQSIENKPTAADPAAKPPCCEVDDATGH